MNAKSALTIAMAAGIASTAAASNTPATLNADHGTVVKAAHIYYNVANGERVVTILNTAGADTGNPESGPIWASNVESACAAQGYDTAWFFGVSNPADTTMGNMLDPLSYDITNMDYGDIEANKVVDCMQVDWVTAHADVDSDSDSVGDGVEELAGQWMVWDADNGRELNRSTRLPLVDVLFFNLPGNIFGAGSLTGYTLDIDLAAFGTATDLSFEIGDTDGDCQSAAFCNSSVDYDSDSVPDGPIGLGDRDFDGNPDSDLDGDGLADWSWTVRFFQPGFGNDFDSDSDTGSAAPTASDTIGVSFGFPEGSAVDNGDGSWSYNIDTSAEAPGTGAEDRFAQYNPPNSTGDITYEGGYFFGGIACTGGLLDEGGSGYAPAAMFQFVLYGPDGNSTPECPADLNGDGELNFFDVSLFVQDYQAGGDYNGDGSTSFFDVSQFIQDYNAGCPAG